MIGPVRVAKTARRLSTTEYHLIKPGFAADVRCVTQAGGDGLKKAELCLGQPSFTREQLVQVRAMLEQEAVSIAHIARETGLTRQTVYRIKDDPAGAEAALAAWGI
jgi:Helix-turn-helix domain of resolvase